MISILFLFLLYSLVDSEPNVTLRHFISVCGDVYTKRDFVLESQGYPSNYPPNTDCSYLIKGPFCPTYFTLQFLDFNVEDSVGCTKDRLEVENLDALCGTKTGTKTYFSNTGALKLRFRSDAFNAGRGFQISVSRSACGTTENHNPKEETDEVLKPQMNAFNLPNCCTNSYDAKTFFITSPNYPKSMNQVADCKIQIRKNNPNVCRLRIHVVFFYLGAPMNPTCGQGFLQIDNKYLCDCKSDLKLIAPFRDSNVKDLRFRSNGLISDSMTGFILEVIQDECPKRINKTGRKFFMNESDQEINYRNNVNTSIIINNDSMDQEINKTDLNKIPEDLTKKLFNESQIKNESFYNDQIHRVAWPRDDANFSSQNHFDNKLDIINEKTEIIDEDRIHTLQSSNFINENPQIVKHVYFFTSPDFKDQSAKKEQDKEETTYIETTSFGTLIRNAVDYNQCRNWNQFQANQIYNRYGRNLPQCKTAPFQNKGSASPANYNPNNNECVELNYLRGYLRSPCYPFYYPGNLNICYRIRKQPGICYVRIYMQDFQLEDSWDCMKDYLSVASFPYKYCGNRLSNTISTLDLRYRQFEEVRFVTDAYNCGRGFYALYEQIACQDMSYPINPVNPLTTTEPTAPQPQPPFYYPTTTTTDRPSSCFSASQEQEFQFDVFGDGELHRECLYEIRKYIPAVCKIELYLDTFHLFCPQEALFINGKRYCGQLNNHKIILNDILNRDHVQIVYKKSVNNLNYPLTGLRSRIHGRQYYTNCYETTTMYPEVPPETELEEDFSKSVKKARKKIPQQDKYLIEMRDRNFKEICKVVTNFTQQTNLETVDFCEILMNSTTKAIKCTPVKEFYTLYTNSSSTSTTDADIAIAAAATAPSITNNNSSNRLQLRNGKLVDEVNYHEIDCNQILNQ